MTGRADEPAERPLRLSDLPQSASDWDIVVIGAGPAGATLACLAARQNARVLLIEKETIPRDKVCGGCLSARGIELLRTCDMHESLLHVANHALTKFRLHHEGASVDIPLPGGVALMRSAFDEQLVRIAIRSGAVALHGATATVQPHNTVALDHRTVEIGESDGIRRQVRARVVVVATGLWRSAVRDTNELPVEVSPKSRIGFGGVLPTTESDDCLPWRQLDTLHMILHRHYYVGVVQIDERRLNIAGAADPQFLKSVGGPARAVSDALATGTRIELSRLTEIAWRGTPRISRTCRAPVAWRMLAIGDAIGYLEPFTGEGMTWGVDSARLGLPLVLRGIEDWNFELQRAASHQLLAAWSRQQRICRVLATVVRSPWMVRASFQLMRICPAISSMLAQRVCAPRVSGT